jgi:hypothetical protein
MAIDFPNSPSSGDIHTVSGKQWQWDGEKWLAYGVSLAPDILKVDTGNSRVGINQTSPTVALDVTGSARITGDLTVSGTTVTVDSASVLVKDRVQFEGATANAYETILLATDPTADRTITLPDATGTVALTGAVPTTITVADTTDTTAFVALWESATGDLAPKSDAGITYNAGTGTLTATAFAGPLTGNVTGNASGTAATVTGAAQTAITSVGTLTSLTVSGGLVAPLQINAQTGTTYTFVIGDAGKLVTSSNGSAQTFTVPPNSSVAFTVGTQIMVQNIGSANCTLAQGSGVTIQSKDSAKEIDGQYSAATLIKTATDVWSLIGSLA